MTLHMHDLLRNLTIKSSAGILAVLVLFTACKHKKTPFSPPRMAPYVIKKVSESPIELPTMIVRSDYGSKEVHPSVWNQKTLRFSDGMPQRIFVE